METKFLKNLSLSLFLRLSKSIHDPLSRDDSKHPFFKSETMESINNRSRENIIYFFTLAREGKGDAPSRFITDPFTKAK